MATITINGNTLDPLARVEELATAGPQLAVAVETNYILVQTAEPLDAEQRRTTRSGRSRRPGVRPGQHVSLPVQAPRPEAVEQLPFVTWAGPYSEGFKIPPALKPARLETLLGPASETAITSPSRKPRQVDVVMHEDVDPTAPPVRQEIAAAAGVNPDDLTIGTRKVRLTIQEGRLPNIAQIDAVRHIEEVPERQLFNNIARSIVNADVTVNGTAYRGAGEIIAVADTGFDMGSTTNVHPAFAGRVKQLYALGRTNPARTDDPHGHGTTSPGRRSATARRPRWAAQSRGRPRKRR